MGVNSLNENECPMLGFQGVINLYPLVAPNNFSTGVFMKKNVLALSVAALVAGFAGGAHAVTNLAGADATALQFGNTGTGHMLVVPYFSTQNGNSTLLSIINTNETVGKAVKVRFRGAANSDDIYDFQVFLSPGDVWTANISQGADGKSFLTTADNSCTKPAKATLNSTPFVTTRLNPAATAEVKANNTREGYIEIFNMADIVAPAAGASNLFTSIKHVNGVAPCANIAATATMTASTAWTSINTETDNATLIAAPIGMSAPTTGLAANWTIINVPKAVAWSGAATAVEAVKVVGGVNVPALGNVVYFPQTSTSIDAAKAIANTADPLLTGVGGGTPAVTGALYDLPDMSTPYLTGGLTPSAQAADLAKSIAATAVMNEYWTDPTIVAKTDWVFSMPTRRYAAAVNYKAADPIIAGAVKPAAVYNAANAGHFAAANTEMSGDKLCVKGITNSPWDREERRPATPDDVVISPSEPGSPVLFCGETSVLSFNNGAATTSGVVSGNVAVKDIDVTYQDGWMKLSTPGAVAANGLPVLGQAFVSAFNPSVAEGTAGNFNMGWSHRFVRP
jgi:hypothetical protein